MTKVSAEIARQDVERWLDFKRVSAKKRAAVADTIEAIAEAIEQGTLVVNDDCSITHKLIFPIENSEGQQTVEELKYKARVTTEAISIRMRDVKLTDAHGMFIAYASALTNQSTALIKKLDTEDFRVAQSIVTFFL